MTKQFFHFELLKTDATNLQADVVFLGHRNPLIQELQFSQETTVEQIKVSTNSRAMMILPKNHPWKRVIVVKYPYRKKIRSSLYKNLSNIFNYCLGIFRPKKILILPFSWRYPDSVAICTLFSLWLVGYFRMDLQAWPKYFTKTIFTIADLYDPLIYKKYIENNYEKLLPFIQKETIKGFGLSSHGLTSKIIFNLVG